jgi:hypothetical protein
MMKKKYEIYLLQNDVNILFNISNEASPEKMLHSKFLLSFAIKNYNSIKKKINSLGSRFLQDVFLEMDELNENNLRRFCKHELFQLKRRIDGVLNY